MPRSRLHSNKPEERALGLGSYSGWNESLSLSGIVPPHGWEFTNRANVEVSTRTVLSIGVVQRCLEVLQNSFFQMGTPLVYRKRFDKTGSVYPVYIPDTNQSFPSLFTGSPWGVSDFADNTPVPYNIGIGKTVASMGLFGEAWWLCTERDSSGFMKNLEVLHPAFVQVPKKEKGKKWRIKYGWGNNITVVDPRDLVYIPRLIMPGDQSAINPVKNESAMFAIALAAVQYSQTWFSQGASPSFILTTDQKLDPDALDRVFQKLLLEHSGFEKANMPMVFDSGIKPQMTQIDPEKSQMNQTLLTVREEIAGYFGIPGHLVGVPGDSGGVWGKGIQEENYGLLDFTLSGYRVPIDESYSAILPRGIFASTSDRKLLRADENDIAQAIMNRRMAAVTTPNEERKWLSLPPAEFGDDISTPLNSNRNVQPNNPENEAPGKANANDPMANGADFTGGGSGSDDSSPISPAFSSVGSTANSTEAANNG